MNLNDDDNKYLCSHINQFDNPEFLELLNVHKVQFLFYKHLYENGLLINDHHYKYLYSLGERFIYLQSKYDEYTSEIKKLTTGLKSNSISYAILKGFSLIDPIYKCDNKIFRTFSDVDILVSKSDIKSVNEILEFNGFTQSIMNNNYEIHPVDKQKIIYWRMTSHQEHEYIKKAKYFNYAPHLYLNVDINFSIFIGGKYIDPIKTEDLLEHTRKRNTSNFEFYSLDYTYELIQLCIHFYKDIYYDIKKLTHDNYNLIKFCDIREYIINYKKYIIWDLFLYLVEKNHIEKEVGNVLLLVSDFYEDLNIDDVLFDIKKKIQYKHVDYWEDLLL